MASSVEGLREGAAAPGSHRYAMEFRHPSFDSDEVRAKLGAAGVALVVSDTEDQPAKFLHTGAFAYVRQRGTGYDENALEGWGASFRSTLEDGVDVFAYLKHEDRATGPRDAAILKRIAGT